MSIKVKAAEVQKNFGRYQDAALAEPVVVTRYGRDSVIILSVAEYRRLEQRGREARAVEKLSDAEAEAIARAVSGSD
jgi:prevent-host-death family protein